MRLQSNGVPAGPFQGAVQPQQTGTGVGLKGGQDLPHHFIRTIFIRIILGEFLKRLREAPMAICSGWHTYPLGPSRIAAAAGRQQYRFR
ncbi:hypothetical protein SBA4_2140010 [Candidatus Sulfopaludibacter sp. SbA4]|nr:hypothetical protein SBA4_2140010 [Candidatus Sulfopaludibacter sp. SbA4]